MTEVSVVIPTRNQADLLRECLRAIHDQTLDPSAYEVVVVDDGSTDHTPRVIGEADRVVTVRFPSNRGRSAARNAGIVRAHGPLVAFIDSDVIVRTDFLSRHLAAQRRFGPGTLSRGPVVMVPDVHAARQARLPPCVFSPAFLDTANACLEKRVLERAGMFDERFNAYGWEDFELGVRLRRLGVRRVFCRDAAGFHVQPRDDEASLTELLRKEDERARSAVYFFDKHPTVETRMLIQATGLHTFLFWLQSGCGRLTTDNVVAVTRRLSSAGLHGLAYLLLRGVLNRYYIAALRMELRRHVAQA